MITSFPPPALSRQRGYNEHTDHNDCRWLDEYIAGEGEDCLSCLISRG